MLAGTGFYANSLETSTKQWQIKQNPQRYWVISLDFDQDGLFCEGPLLMTPPKQLTLPVSTQK